jgi:hypothetical protein
VAEQGYDELARDLTALGRTAAVPPPTGGLETAVMARVAVLPAPRRPAAVAADWWREHRRRFALLAGAVLLALLATPPVRAAVADWFGFGAVKVEQRDSGPTGPASPPPTVAPGRPASEAAAAVGFSVSVPAELGEPDGVHVAADRASVSMSWTTAQDGVLRLDQFGARLDFAVVKRAPGVLFTDVGGGDGVWFEEPHEIALLENDGTPVRHSARLAGHTLIWQDGDVTLRLEGDVSLERAVQIAESAVPVG